MKLTKKDWLYLGGGMVLTFIVLKLLNKNKMQPTTIKGSYIVPLNAKNRADALHSFERRKSDGFGGRMSTQIKEKLRELYRAGINPDVTYIKIKVDSSKYQVDWEATIQPSKDGKAYVGISTIGSAGSGADARAKSQIEAMKKWNANAKDYTLVLDFVNPKGVYIRQYFYKWTNPTDFPSH
jgi:hypothetical protein